jgi:hypothetical protein
MQSRRMTGEGDTMRTETTNEIEKTVPEWIEVFAGEGRVLNLRSTYKRRQVAGIGRVTGPRKQYMMTRDEFLAVLNTPLPMCSQVIA